ncbi:stage II sporulation protein P [Priestia abyssalis]|uniref:stage II sporulation protein P n=1 Tax=Priestia abyssalis TaxID=1221450 RepID=UPI0009953E02|nr:stage II sporulation protein P [Priestia abyssalis]
MKFGRPGEVIVSVNGAIIRKLIIVFVLGLVMLFVMVGMLTSLKPQYRISSSSLGEVTDELSISSFVHLFSYENHYFKQALSPDIPSPGYFNELFQFATRVNLDDPRSLLGNELPGFYHFDSEIIVAEEGLDYTTIPYESAPPLEVLMAEREASIQNLELDKPAGEKGPVQPPALSTNGKNVVFIYHSHSSESYLPHLKGVTDPDAAYHSKVNVTMVGKKLAEELTERGIGSQVNVEDMTQKLKQKGWNFSKSYAASREVVQSALASNRDLQYLFDLHRDANRREATTVAINGKDYAKIAFVIGGENADYERNEKLAKDLHSLINKKYPGLSRGVFTKRGKGTNGKFNQDLSQKAILFEFGGVDNSFEELNRTAEAVADIFSEYYWEAEKVNGTVESKQ